MDGKRQTISQEVAEETEIPTSLVGHSFGDG